MLRPAGPGRAAPPGASHSSATFISEQDINGDGKVTLEEFKLGRQIEFMRTVRASTSRFTAAGASLGRAGNDGVNIRGLEGNRVLMSLDGIRLPQGFSLGAFASGRADYIDSELLASAEILRGPASTQFGSDGLGGALILRTLAPEDLLVQGRQRAGFAAVSAFSADRSAKVSAGFAAAGPRPVPQRGLGRYPR